MQDNSNSLNLNSSNGAEDAIASGTSDCRQVTIQLVHKTHGQPGKGSSFYPGRTEAQIGGSLYAPFMFAQAPAQLLQ